MSSGEHLTFHLPSVIEDIRDKGGLIHNLQAQPGVTDALARHGLRTTGETRDPGFQVRLKSSLRYMAGKRL